MAQNHNNSNSDGIPGQLNTLPPDEVSPHRVVDDEAVIFFKMGYQYQLEGHPDKAITCYRKALILRPDLAETYYNIGIAFQDQGYLYEAVGAYRKALEINPGHTESNLNMGAVFQDQGRFKEAIEYYTKALAITPGYAKAHHNLGFALLGIGKAEEAIASCMHALRLNPAYIEVYNTMGIALLDQGKLKDAAECYRQALRIKPDNLKVYSNLVLSMNYDPGIDQARIYSETTTWWQSHGVRARAGIVFQNDFTPDKRIRIGYVSPDFRQHSVSCFFLPLIASHNKTEFEIYCYAEVKNPDKATERIKSLADHWRTTVGLTDDVVAEIIRKDQIDVLVDLAGHTAGNRLGVFLLKPAPVQINWLGYPNTTGMPGMDYRLTDNIADPKEIATLYHSEALIRLPNGFLCYAPPDDIIDPTVVRSTPDDPITFGCFNNLSKINENVIGVWSEILHQVPGSCLLLKSKQLNDEATRHRYLALFQQKGISATRIKMLPRTQSICDHFALYNHVDIVLDPFPYNGTTTTCEALWMGVPVIALSGDRHAARVGASILTWAGLPELVTESEKAYIAESIRLAGSPDRLQDFKERLRGCLKKSRLCDAAGFAVDMETVFRQLWQCRCNQSVNPSGTKLQENPDQFARHQKETTTPVPNDYLVYYHRGIDFQNQGFLDKAIFCYQKALSIKPDLAEASYNLGIAYLDLSRNDDAVSCFQRAVKHKPDFADAYNNLGNIYADRGNFYQALLNYRQAVELNPRSSRPYYNLGNLYLKVAKPDESIGYYKKALTLKPDYAAAYNSLGNAFEMQGELEQAIINYQNAIDLQPDFAEAFYNLGNTSRKLGQNQAAIKSYQQATGLRDDYHDAYNNLGNLFKELGDLERARENYQRALKAKPEFPEACYNLGNTLHQQGKTAAAIESFKQAIRLKPMYAEAHSNMGNAYKELGYYQDAMVHYNQAIALQPDLPEANFNRSLVYLLHQDFHRGWEGFEWRFKQAEMKSIYPHRLKAPRWDGSGFKGRRLLVHCEQGLGDTLQFVRYLPLVKALGGTVIFETRKALIKILKNVSAIDHLIERSPIGNPSIAFDFQVPLMSLPAIFQTTIDTIPADTPYLFARARTVNKWHSRMFSQERKLKVGIVWAGKPGHTNDHNRSIGAELLAPLGHMPGVQLYSLQKGEAAAQLEQISGDDAIADLGTEFIDFEDTAGAIANLDLIVSVDTAVAHLAGAMGKPTWVLLPFVPDWRWLIDREDSPWYPTMRLFRQPTAGDWLSVCQGVVESLKKLSRLPISN